MNAVTTTPTPPSILEAYAHEHGMDGAAMYATLAATIFPNKSATRTQVDALLIVARAYGLNPFVREIWAYPAKGGGIVPIVSVDGWAKLANTHPQCAGIEISVAMEPDGKTPISATCRVHRRDWVVPFELTEYLHEVKRGTEPWNKQPVRMLRHRAMIQAVRVAFGFGGIYEADEAARQPGVEAPPEYRESEVVKNDPLSRELQTNTATGAAPREAEGETGGAAPQAGPPTAPESPHAKAIAAFEALGVPACVVEAEIAQVGTGATEYLRVIYGVAKSEGARALITRLRSEAAADLLDAHLGADPTPAATALFGDMEAAHED